MVNFEDHIFIASWIITITGSGTELVQVWGSNVTSMLILAPLTQSLVTEVFFA
jgi:hypothetical protein